jgi:hypothetical protein
MGQVTIEGTLTPSVYLSRGRRRTVAVTDEIRNLVKIGAVKVVAGSLDGPTETPASEMAAAAISALGGDPERFLGGAGIEVKPFDAGGDLPPGYLMVNDTDESIEVSGPPTVEIPADGSAPPKNASRAAWAAFLTSQGVEFPDGDDDAAGRDDLIAIWQQASGGS